MKITWFGHSAFRIETGSSVIMLDPFLSENPTWTGTVEEASRGATHVILTHGHHDHIGDSAEICKTTGALLVANFEICMYLSGEEGVENFSPGNQGGEQDLGDFTAALVPAWHSSSFAVDGKLRYMGTAGGIVIMPKTPGDPTVYHAGDTALFSDMALIDELYAPTVGFIPIGDRFTMGARQAAFACMRYFNFDTVIPCHYGTFPIIDQTADSFVREMHGSQTEVVVPKIGEAVRFEG
ncbi:MAG: metal-dependent hydrolase [Rhodobiaceae bacterium]|nr:metal-dependent hydrolase [Rhodobiaceae bacterium]